MKRLAFATGAVIALGVLLTISKQVDAPVPSIDIARTTSQNEITIGWVGDMVPSNDSHYNDRAFDAVLPLLNEQALMIGNLEGTFANPDRISKCVYMVTDKCHAFRGDPSFAEALKNAGFDMVSLVNNHSYDYGDEGLDDTTRELERVGLAYISQKKPTIQIEVRGKVVGILGISSTPPQQTITDYDFITREVSKLKETSDYVVVLFHGGAEGVTKTTVPYTTEYVGTENRGDVAKVAEVARLAGADAVLGAGPHVLRPIEVIEDTIIAYSLGNFVGGRRLVMTGALKNSGILTANLTTRSYRFVPITLTSEGIPTLPQ